jgi:hypothetical protein
MFPAIRGQPRASSRESLDAFSTQTDARFDPVLMGVRDPAARDRLFVALHPVQDRGGSAVLAGDFDIVLV